MSRLLEALRAEGQFDSTGQFGVDRRLAQEKMRQFQLVDPRSYVLNLVAAAVALGASRVTITGRVGRCRIILHGLSLDSDFLTQPLSFIFIRSERLDLDGYRELAVGLSGALSLSRARLELTSGGRRVVLRGFDTAVADAAPGADTSILVQTRQGWPLHKRDSEDLGTVLVRAAHASIPVTLNGRPVTTEAEERPFLQRANGIEIWLGQSPGRVEFIKHGILVATRDLNLRTPAISARVFSDTLRKNVSDSDLVEDERYLQVLSDLDRACDRWLEQTTLAYASAIPRYQALARPQLLRSIGTTSPGQLPLALTRVPLFETLSGTLLSVDALLSLGRTSGVILYVAGEVPLLPDVKHVVLRLRDQWAQLAAENTVGRYLKARSMESLRSSLRPPLPRCNYLVVTSFNRHGLVGELGILRQNDEAAVVRFFQGFELMDSRLSHPGLSYRVDVESADFRRRSHWTVPQQQRQLATVESLIASELDAACRWLARTVKPPHADVPAVQRILLGWLSMQRHEFRVPEEVESYPMFEVGLRSTVTLAALRKDRHESGAVYYARVSAPLPDTERRHVVTDPALVPFLRPLFHSAVDCTSNLHGPVVASTGAMEAPATTLCQVSYQAGALGVEVGIPLVASGNQSTLSFYREGRLLETRTMVIDFGPLQARLESKEFSLPLTEEHVRQAMHALAQGVLLLAEAIGRALLDAPQWLQAQLRLALMRLLLRLGAEAPARLLDVPLFSGLGRRPVSLRELKASRELRYVSQDVGEVEGGGVVLVCEAAEAELAARLSGAPVSNWEHGLQETLLRQGFLARPTTAIKVSEHCIHVHAVADGCIGLLAPGERFDGHSQVRVLWQQRLIETVSVATPVPVDAVLDDARLTPQPHYQGVQRDEAWEALMQRLTRSIDDAIAGLLPRGAHGAVGQTLLLWATRRADDVTALARLPVDSLLEKVAGLPLLADNEGHRVSLRQLARGDGVCRYVSNGGAAAEPRVVLRPHEVTWLSRLFSMVDCSAEHQGQRFRRGLDLVTAVCDCLSTWNGRHAIGLTDDVLVSIELRPGRGLVTREKAGLRINSRHPLVQRTEPRTVVALASAIHAAFSPQTSVDFYQHLVAWLEGAVSETP